MDNRVTFEEYCNFIKDIFKLISPDLIDERGDKFRLNIRKPMRDEKISTLSIKYLYGVNTMENLCEIVLSNDVYRLNDVIKEKIPNAIVFLESLVKDYDEFDLLLLCVLHEFGHVKLELEMDKIDMCYDMDIIDKLCYNLNKDIFNNIFKFNFDTDYLYRLNPKEIYADRYAYNNYINIHKKLERKNVFKNKLDIPRIKDDRNNIDTLKSILSALTINDYNISFNDNIQKTKVDCKNKNIILKNRIKIPNNNNMRSFFKMYLKDDNKNMKKLFWYISSILFNIEIQDNDFLYLYSKSLGSILSTYDIKEEIFSELFIVDNLALIHFFEYINKINEFDLSRIKK